MNLTAPSEVKALLDQLDLRPSKVLGQNFLIDANILRILLAAAELRQSDQVLEVGPGLGVVTEWLERWAGRVVAIEKDRRLFEHLKDRFAKSDRVELIHADVLDVDLAKLLAGGINKMVANLPYSIASRLLVTLIQSPQPPERMVITVQKEVAHRLNAKPETKDYGLLSILTQLRYDVVIEKDVRPTCFLPAPEVHSSIVNLQLLEQPPTVADVDQLTALLKLAFSRRRKQLHTVLASEFHADGRAIADRMLAGIGVRAEARPENVLPAEWAAFSNALVREGLRLASPTESP
ncbi:MAG TPA: 16S rRNA (adenine(1518)-N(6)/adenine(1519)-N(6))-dimethyltransferase RsmA [Kiritimatiellia bacterium]|nr:16S rRNA (adenine(1518)-N(6)/adenine(1519)-N(6))-dimethyltransferase RsmA [Kiritimatiellia bacterium]